MLLSLFSYHFCKIFSERSRKLINDWQNYWQWLELPPGVVRVSVVTDAGSLCGNYTNRLMSGYHIKLTQSQSAPGYWFSHGQAPARPGVTHSLEAGEHCMSLWNVLRIVFGLLRGKYIICYPNIRSRFHKYLCIRVYSSVYHVFSVFGSYIFCGNVYFYFQKKLSRL